MAINITVEEIVETVNITTTINETIVNVTRTSGSGSSLQLGETDTTAYRGDLGKEAYDHAHTGGNPHEASTNDIPDYTDKRYVTDSEKTEIAHTNRSILDAITESFTTALKTAYDASVTWISTNGTNLINHLTNTSNPHSTTASQVGAVATNTAITGATKTKITYDTKGLVTSGADATTYDIADSTDKRYVTDSQLVVVGNTSGTNTGDETTLSIQTKRPLKTINNVSIEGSGNANINIDFRHIFAFNNTFSASTSWYALGRESASLYDLTNFVTTTYNGTTILEARCVKFPIPYNCKLKKAQIIFSTLATAVDLRVLYFENTSGNTNVLNQITIASLSLPVTSNNTVTNFSSQDLTTQLNAGGYVTFALFNNNVSTGVMRNIMLILDFEPI